MIMFLLDHAVLIWAGFLAVILVLGLVCKPDAMEAFNEECRKRGMDFRETQDALAIRVAFVRLRRISSDLCIKLDGAITKEHFAEIVNHEAQGLHLINGMKTAKSFIAWANSCPDTEILYPDAVEIYMRHVREQIAKNKVEIDPAVAKQAAEDLAAAVRVVRR